MLDIQRVRTSEVSIVQVALTSDLMPMRRLEKTADRLRERLDRVAGVREAKYWGAPPSEVQVTLDLARLSALRLPATAVADALKQAGAEGADRRGAGGRGTLQRQVRRSLPRPGDRSRHPGTLARRPGDARARRRHRGLGAAGALAPDPFQRPARGVPDRDPEGMARTSPASPRPYRPCWTTTKRPCQPA
ncbi:hypothetical protein ACRAWD_01740 [Caulobacter segnis]